jgi:hypothetical protein
MAIPLLLGRLHDAGRLAIGAYIVNFLFSLQSIPIKQLGPRQDAEWLRIPNPTSPPRTVSAECFTDEVRFVTGIWRTNSTPDKKRAPFQVP